MTITDVFSEIQDALDGASPNEYVVALQLQVIKHSDALQNVTGKEFCEILSLRPSLRSDFVRMRNIAPRLKEAGLDIHRI